MRLFILSLLTIMANSSYCQTSQPMSFLIVQTGRDYDWNKELYYTTIQTTNTNQSLTELLQIVPYKPKKKKTDASVAFYKEQTDTAATLYNYFDDESEALQFITSKGWELFSIISQTTSEVGEHLVNGQYQTYTKVSTTPIYYFRKPLR